MNFFSPDIVFSKMLRSDSDDSCLKESLSFVSTHKTQICDNIMRFQDHVHTTESFIEVTSKEAIIEGMKKIYCELNHALEEESTEQHPQNLRELAERLLTAVDPEDFHQIVETALPK